MRPCSMVSSPDARTRNAARSAARRARPGWSAVWLFAVAVAGGAHAASPATSTASTAHTPPRDQVVATQLLPRALKASLRRQAAQAPLDSAQRLALARQMIEAGRASGDPRTLGYAEALLAPWPAAGADVAGGAPGDVHHHALVLRATIEGSRHRFDAARTLLDRVLARDPAHAQALLTRATMKQVTGDHAAARADCARLHPLAAVAAAICDAGVDALTGANNRALTTLRAAGAQTRGALRGWALALQAQVLEANGDAGAAAAAYRASLLAADDLTTRLSYADLLLANGAPGAAEQLLAQAPDTDGVLLRRWQAARMAESTPRAAELEQRLAVRFAAAAARGDLLHAREAALFALARGESAQALRLAQDNWRTQHEPADLQVLAHAARQAGDAAVLAQARDWIARTHLSDVRLAPLLHGDR